MSGLAHCGAGSGRITGGTVELTSEAGAVLVVDLCRRCRRRVEVLSTDALHEVMDRRDTPSRIRLRILNRVLDALELPTSRARIAELAADVRAAARARLADRRPRHAVSGLGAFAAAHREAIERDRAARAAGQLALI